MAKCRTIGAADMLKHFATAMRMNSAKRGDETGFEHDCRS
jgi:hypothetical protein